MVLSLEEKLLCLYGWPNGTWEVNLPLEEVPVELPEPICGIDFARDGTPKKVWLSVIAIHSDAWLMSMAFHHAGRVAFDRDDRFSDEGKQGRMGPLCTCLVFLNHEKSRGPRPQGTAGCHSITTQTGGTSVSRKSSPCSQVFDLASSPLDPPRLPAPCLPSGSI